MLISIFVLKIVVAIYTYRNEDEVLELLKKNIKNAVKNLYGQSSIANETSVKGVDWLQRNVREYREIYLV